MKLRSSLECWRELAYHFADDTADIDIMAENVQDHMLRALDDAGVRVEHAHRQTVGAYVLIQSCTPAEQTIWDEAINSLALVDLV